MFLVMLFSTTFEEERFYSSSCSDFGPLRTKIIEGCLQMPQLVGCLHSEELYSVCVGVLEVKSWTMVQSHRQSGSALSCVFEEQQNTQDVQPCQRVSINASMHVPLEYVGYLPV